MINKRCVFISFLSLLLVINILLNFKIHEFKKELRIHVNSLNMKDQTINKLETAFKNYYLKRTIILNVDSFKTNNIALTKALSSGEKIICYVQKGACTSCALRLMQDLSILE